MERHVVLLHELHNVGAENKLLVEVDRGVGKRGVQEQPVPTRLLERVGVGPAARFVRGRVEPELHVEAVRGADRGEDVGDYGVLRALALRPNRQHRREEPGPTQKVHAPRRPA